MRMVIDAQAIEHLELLEVGGKANKGSFFDYISSGCSTSFGKRLLKRWVVSPLQSKEKIDQRLDAVTALIDNKDILDKFQTKLGALPDIERLLSRIYTYSAK
jgi:DNA mismatch repair protein MSH6